MKAPIVPRSHLICHYNALQPRRRIVCLISVPCVAFGIGGVLVACGVVLVEQFFNGDLAKLKII